DAADPPDTVRVSPGTYGGIVDFYGKGVVVQSSDGPAVTTLDAEQHYGIVTCRSGEEADAVLQGFTIRNASGGAAVFIASGSSPTIRGNVITENRDAGIAVVTGSPTIEHNEFVNNHAGGINLNYGMVRDTAHIVGNHFVSNEGGAIYMNRAGSPLVRDNIFEDNSSSSGAGAISGGGSSRSIIQNLFARNRGSVGGAIQWSVFDERGPYVIQNTFVDNVADQGSAIFLGGDLRRTLIE